MQCLGESLRHRLMHEVLPSAMLLHRLRTRLGLKAAQPFTGPLPLAWHLDTGQLAAADAVDRVHICDAPAAASTSGRGQPGRAQSLSAKLTLHHELQQQACPPSPSCSRMQYGREHARCGCKGSLYHVMCLCWDCRSW